MQSYDVVIAGGGPVGAVAAIGFARRGAKVALLEANPGHRRLAGELLHPGGVASLRAVGIPEVTPALGHPPVRGFAVFSPEHPAPITLDYTGEPGRTFEYNALVAWLRELAAGTPGVTWLPEHRVVDKQGDAVSWRAQGGSTGEFRTPLLVGADGKFSHVRELVRRARPGAAAPERHVLTHMAGLLLHGVDVPFEGYGHVVLGSAGPALIYRIAPDAVRVCLDVPAPWKSHPRRSELLWDAYGPALPESLREPLRRALSGPVQWAVNQLAPRLDYGTPDIALVGDAVGHFHPMTAVGLSLGFADAECVARAPSVEAYRAERTRDSQSPGLLATALYEIFALDSEPTAACRAAIFSLWKRPGMRRKTMGFLSVTDTSLVRLIAVGFPIATLAAAHVARQAAADRRLGPALSSTRRIAGLAQWLAFESVPESMQFLPRWPSPFEPVRLQRLAELERAA